MRPPSCIACSKTLDPNDARALSESFELVAFADYVPLPDGQVGHPRGYEWLCAEHLAAGQARSHLTSGDAAAEIRAEFGLDG